MAHDDYYQFDPHWDDTKPELDELCQNCWQTEEKCSCDEAPEDWDTDEYL
jgi:hypothetical protein